MGFGLPAIASREGAPHEVITEGEDGFLVPYGDVPTLAARLNMLAADRGLLERMSLAARDRYLRQPEWSGTAASIREFLVKYIQSNADYRE
jgi:glycosyltransferase involved in cell wall biosynthesis